MVKFDKDSIEVKRNKIKFQVIFLVYLVTVETFNPTKKNAENLFKQKRNSGEKGKLENMSSIKNESTTVIKTENRNKSKSVHKFGIGICFKFYDAHPLPSQFIL